jgi:hypothetical protein
VVNGGVVLVVLASAETSDVADVVGSTEVVSAADEDEVSDAVVAVVGVVEDGDTAEDVVRSRTVEVESDDGAEDVVAGAVVVDVTESVVESMDDD